jgi:hypothetical protein
MVVLAGGSIAITVLGLPRYPRALRSFCEYVAKRPPLPSRMAFVVVVMVSTIGAMWLVQLDGGSNSFVYTMLIVSLLLLGTFSLMCGCVINRRTGEGWLAKAREWWGQRRRSS